MHYRRFGKTELQMPVLSCGGMRFLEKWPGQKFDQIESPCQANLEAIIERAIEVGINHFETARGYGNSELQLGKILPKLPRDEIIVQTKVGLFEEAQEFLDNFETSMGLMQVDKFDLLGLHGINTTDSLDKALRPGGCLDAAEKLREQGRVDYIGFSTHGRTETILEAIESDRFDYVNLHWYYIFQDNRPAIEAAAQRDMGVFIISPSDKGGMLYDPPEIVKQLCEPLSPMVFNDLFCLSNSDVKTLSVGAARTGDFDEHLKAIELLDQADQLIDPIVKRLDHHLSERLGEHWVQTWQQGLPLPEHTPGGINIPVILWLRNLVLGFDLIKYCKMRFNLFGEGGSWFPGERIENLNALKSLDFSACLSQSPHAEKIPGYLAQTYELLAGEAVNRLTES
jgi:predicted aldo/keto reductase-like oxidoreductase